MTVPNTPKKTTKIVFLKHCRKMCIRDSMYPYLTYQEFLDACGLTEEALNLD